MSAYMSCVFSLTIETNKTKGKEQDDWDIVTEEFSSTSLAYGRKPPSRLWKLNGTGRQIISSVKGFKAE